MVALGDADAMVTGVTRNYSPRSRTCAASSTQARPPRHRRVDGAVRAAARCWSPTPRARHADAEELADIAEEAAGVARRLGYEPRVAHARLLDLRPSAGRALARVREAVKILDQRRVDFEYDGEMAADVALNRS
jgi:malate dehydrogenase (oxaloacetate-decarboxylating)(NADP+)